MLFKSNFFQEVELFEGSLMKTRGKKVPIGTIQGGYKKISEKKWEKVKTGAGENKKVKLQELKDKFEVNYDDKKALDRDIIFSGTGNYSLNEKN